MLVLAGPNTVLVLRNPGDLLWQDTAVATAGSTSAGAVVLSNANILSGSAGNKRYPQEDEAKVASYFRLGVDGPAPFLLRFGRNSARSLILLIPNSIPRNQ